MYSKYTDYLIVMLIIHFRFNLLHPWSKISHYEIFHYWTPMELLQMETPHYFGFNHVKESIISELSSEWMKKANIYDLCCEKYLRKSNLQIPNRYWLTNIKSRVFKIKSCKQINNSLIVYHQQKLKPTEERKNELKLQCNH